MVKFGTPELNRIGTSFYAKYGRALSEWAVVEMALSEWFGYVVYSHDHAHLWIAHNIFYSARSFNGMADMLEKAFYASRHDEKLTAFFKEAMKRSRSYSQFRNILAHHECLMNAPKKRMEVRDQRDPFGRGDIVYAKQLDVAARNFNQLALILLKTLPPSDDLPGWYKRRHLTPEQGLQRVRRLPTLADSTISTQRKTRS